jgi:hypothetical protein
MLKKRGLGAAVAGEKAEEGKGGARNRELYPSGASLCAASSSAGDRIRTRIGWISFPMIDPKATTHRDSDTAPTHPFFRPAMILHSYSKIAYVL